MSNVNTGNASVHSTAYAVATLFGKPGKAAKIRVKNKETGEASVIQLNAYPIVKTTAVIRSTLFRHGGVFGSKDNELDGGTRELEGVSGVLTYDALKGKELPYAIQLALATEEGLATEQAKDDDKRIADSIARFAEQLREKPEDKPEETATATATERRANAEPVKPESTKNGKPEKAASK